jgi:hypothetical protein
MDVRTCSRIHNVPVVLNCVPTSDPRRFVRPFHGRTLLQSLATASPWTSLGRLDALPAPPQAFGYQRGVIMLPVIVRPTKAVPPAQPIPVVVKDLSVVVQTGLNAAVPINVGLVQASGVVEARTFAVTRAALRNFELQQSCPL